VEGRTIRCALSLALFVLLACALVAAAAPDAGNLDSGPPLGPGILEALSQKGQVDLIVFLREQAQLEPAYGIASRPERGQFVYQALQEVADRTQAVLRAELEARGASYHPFFIVNAISVTADQELATWLAARPEVDRLVLDPAFDGLDDPPPGPAAPPGIEAVEWNIARVNADDVWALGYTGQDIVVGSCDTGVDWDHPALINQYRGGAGDHDYHWYDVFGEYTQPTDPNGHGTHTTGTMVGDDGGTNQVGMAPGAEWIACKVNSGSVWKASKYIECWEWFLAPTRVDGTDPDPAMAPHVINNSWSCPGSEGCDPDTLRDAAKALYAAGIAIAKSGGNEGSNCGTITNPGHYPELLATAAFAQGDTIASFSSRGPVTVDGETVIKPDIAAPGVGIRSAYPGGGYSSLQGTSMAAPHTAGLIALLWSAKPDLIGDLDATFQIVRASAEPKLDAQCPPTPPTGVPNNVWGWGVIDALEAVQTARDVGLGVLSGTVTDDSTGDPVDGVVIELMQTDNHLVRETLTALDGSYEQTLLAATYHVTATHYGYLPAVVPAVDVFSGTTTMLDLALDPAPQWILSGTVTGQDTGLPLRAVLHLLDTPVTVATDPATGGYVTDVAEGSYLLRVESPGYQPEERPIDVQGDLIEDFVLTPEPAYMVRESSRPCGPSFEWIDITATGQAYNLGDDANQYVSLGGGSFTFYGTSYSNLFIGSNGFITFGSGSSYPGGNAIPSTFLPNNAIYAFWDDLNPANGAQGTIYTELVDGHLFVIEFYQVEHYPSGDPETFEIILDLDTGSILLEYLAVTNTSWTTVGIENSDGSAGISYAFHDPAVPTDTLAILFYPMSGAFPAEQGSGELSGLVTGSDGGQPIAGATVDATAQTTGEVVSYTTDAVGVYSGTLCADWYQLAVSAAGYRPSDLVPVAVVSGTHVTQDFVLERAAADLWITKTAPSETAPGAQLTYTLEFGSDGPDQVPAAQIWDPLSPQVSYVSGGTYSETLHAVYWELSDLDPGVPPPEELVVQVSDVVTVGHEICNLATIGAIGSDAPDDPNTANNESEACTTVVSAGVEVYLPVILK
jgi:subtilisin family serine protease